MTEIYKFVGQFIRQRKSIGAIAPSSKFLVDKIVERIDFNKASVIVELGAGTGSFTFEIIKNLHPESILIVFETNSIFYNFLKTKINDRRVYLVNDTAERLEEYLPITGYNKADYIVSSLPLSNFSSVFQDKMLRRIYSSLAERGRFIQYQYSLVLFDSINRFFKNVTIEFTLLNFPPAFVFLCTKNDE